MARSCVATVVMAALLATSVASIPTYSAQIPNGNNVVRNGQPWPGVGHVTAAGGGERNQFGADFAAAGRSWTTALCNNDSDNDGFTNGVELGDPNCVWSVGQTPARTTGISHPGFSDSVPSVTTTAPPTTTSAPATPPPLGATPAPTTASSSAPLYASLVALTCTAVLAAW